MGALIMTKFGSRFYASWYVFMFQVLVVLIVSSASSWTRSAYSKVHQSKSKMEVVRVRVSGITNALYCTSKRGAIYIDEGRVTKRIKVVRT